MPQTRKQIRPTKRGWMLIAVVAVLLLSAIADAAARADQIRPGVKVGSLNLGGRSFSAAERALTTRAKRIAENPATLRAGKHVVTVSPDALEFLPDVDATLARARAVGRKGNVFARAWTQLRTLFVATDIGWVSELNESAAKKLIAHWAESFDDEGHEASIKAQDGRLVPVNPLQGRQLDRRAAISTVERALQSWPRRPVALPFQVRGRRTDPEDARKAAEEANDLIAEPVTLTSPAGSVVLQPAELAGLLDAVPQRSGSGWSLRVRFAPEAVGTNLAERMRAFERPAADATFAVSGPSVSVLEGQDGLAFDPAKTAEALDAAVRRPAPRSAEAAFKVVPPRLTTEQARALKITELVSSYTTRHPAGQPRVTNIHRIADTVDGTIVRPGEVFSLNRKVGERTPAKGYVLAPMIYDGEFKDQVGGGVSQFAATMFNAVFFGGYEFVTYQAHSYYISRYPAGREATISWPAPDLKFRNNSPAGVLIKTSYSSSSITVSFYGTKQFDDIRSEEEPRSNITQPPEKRTPDPSVPPGQEKVKQSGVQGFDIVVWRVFIRGAAPVRRQKFFTRYLPEPMIILVGPGTPSPASPPPSPAPTS